MQKYSDCKLVISNNIFEFYEYEHEIEIGEKQEESKPRGAKRNKPKNRLISFQNSKRTLRRLINTNIEKWTDHNGQVVPPKFITLTFIKNKQDIKHANYQYKKFIQRLNYSILNQKKNYFKYAVVIEFQKRGAIHYHALFFNLLYMKNNRLAKLWSNGFVRINRIDNEYNIGSYVTKYMTKTGDLRLCGEKSYFTSQGLLKPIITYEKNEVGTIFNIMPKNIPSYKFEFENKYTGNSIYYQFNLKEYPELKNTIQELITEEDIKPIYVKQD